jgi:CRP/FNR family transcriptional regulator, cyclic AMP receptor protein
VSQIAGALIRGIPLFAGIEPAELDAFLRIFEPVSIAAGTPLVRQGQPADGAFIIESGNADVITALPGGGEATVAKLGPGSVLGEMALLESGIRSATVMARSPVLAHFIERDGFRMLLAQRNRAAFTIQSRITLTLCQRLRDLNAKIVAHDTAQNPAPAMTEQGGSGTPPQRGACSFDWRSFLSALQFFRRYSASEIEAFAESVQVMELPRGRALFRQGDASDACYVVVRGAIEITGFHNGQRHRIGMLGPGRLCGTLALIEGQRHSMSAAARENTVLLEIGKDAFVRLFQGDDRLAARFREAVNQELLQTLARTNNHLTRLISQARIRGRRVEELQQALGAQDCRPS